VIRITLKLCCLVLGVFLTTQVTAKAFSENDVAISYTVSGKNIDSNNIKLWRRQLLTITISINTDEEFSYIKQIDNSIDGFKLVSANQSIKAPGENYFTKKLLIYLWPKKPGAHSILLKPVKLFLSGRAIKIINIPELTLDVKALPSYLPPGFPVGHIELDISYNSTSLLPFIFIKDQISSAHYQLISKGLHPDFIPAYFQYLKADSLTTLQSREIKTSISSDNKFTFTQTHETPFVTNRNGLISVNDIKISYFDPVESKIVSFKTGSNKLLSVNGSFYILIIILLLVLMVWILKQVYLLLRFIRMRRCLWQAIIDAENQHELTSALLRFLPISTIRKNHIKQNAPIDLTNWCSNWQITALSPVVSELNQLNYAPAAECTLDDIKKSFIDLLKQNESFVFYLAIN